MENYKEVHSFDGNGLYTGTVKAHKSPLEENVFLLPANSTDKIPELVEGVYCRFIDGEWINEEIEEEQVETPSLLDLLSEAIEKKKAEINIQREEMKNSLTSFTKNEEDYFFDRGILLRETLAVAAIISLEEGETVDWVADNDIIVSLTHQEILSICKDIVDSDTRELKIAALRKNEIMVLGEIKEGDNIEERIAEIENYDITKVFTD
tara:strand:- start:3778 stop:4401 length:624 start_codon:yes stop_codon:yes gene_type:complete